MFSALCLYAPQADPSDEEDKPTTSKRKRVIDSEEPEVRVKKKQRRIILSESEEEEPKVKGPQVACSLVVLNATDLGPRRREGAPVREARERAKVDKSVTFILSSASSHPVYKL